MTVQLKLAVQRALLGCAIAAALPLVAHADVTTEERISVSGFGLMQMANMSGKTVTTIAGNRARTESDLQFESGLLRAFARGVGKSTEIVRLDQDKVYSLDVDKKTYTETTFADYRAQMQKSMDQMRKAQESQQQGTSGVDESQCEWSEPKAEVVRNGEKATIGGYNSERVTVTATQSCKDKETGQVCDFGLTLDQWLAPNFEASEEALAYQRAFAEKMGVAAASSKDFAERAETMFGRYKGIWTEIAAKTKDLKGYPVKASFSMGIGGPQCQSTKEAQQAGGGQAAPPPSIGGALGGALGGLLGGRKKEQQPAPAANTPPPVMPGGLMPLMTVSSELVGVRRNPVDAQTFEVPAGFKKK
jgi:hypothetical protein